MSSDGQYALRKYLEGIVDAACSEWELTSNEIVGVLHSFCFDLLMDERDAMDESDEDDDDEDDYSAVHL